MVVDVVDPMTQHLQAVRYPYTGSRERFLRNVETHAMTVVLDTVTHKHLQFRRPGTGMYWFDLLTWPGTLIIRGDMGTFVLARESDMFAWISHDRGINPGYWAEKVVAGKDGVYEAYPDPDATREWVTEVAQGVYENGGTEDDICHAVDEAYGAIDDGDYETLRSIEPFQDFYAAEHCEYSWQWIWCCHAMVWGVTQYRARRKDADATHSG